MTRVALALILAALPLAAAAQQVSGCDGWLASAQALAEPWEQNSRSFANGDVRLAVIDAVEPGAVPFHLLILSPPWDELGVRQCRVLSFQQGIGFAGIDFAALAASYDPATGLLFSLPVKIYEGTGPVNRMLDFSLNQATGAIEAFVGPMGE